MPDPGTPKTIKELKITGVIKLGYFFHKYPKRPLQMPKRVCLPEVARHKLAKTGSFTLSTADRQPRLGMTADIVNLLTRAALGSAPERAALGGGG